ncbi:hypothetical protein HMPREF9456_02280 [Dysgonomonas mossii DSM 22836]|uniref:Uncharacterized protein n=1 Tax=Dysgonomonas mossii DSM 22836 TaxID=742767 RepID=F8X1N2_9BACT|nr:hypothetical protein HMPREF9456_02280 [Dysgonomonas mossii DSM 22836]
MLMLTILNMLKANNMNVKGGNSFKVKLNPNRSVLF